MSKNEFKMSLSFSSNNITKQNKKTYSFFTFFFYLKMICCGKDSKTKKDKEMIKDNNCRGLKF